MSAALPKGLDRVRTYDPSLADELTGSFLRLARASEALVWAQARLAPLLAAHTTLARLELLVAEARAASGAPSVWAVSWRRASRGPLHLDAVAGDGHLMPAPSAISRTIVGAVLKHGRPAWSDDAVSDARFEDASSVHAFQLRSVGCLPLGDRGVLYMADADNPGRFSLECRARTTALCALAGPLLDAPAGSPPTDDGESPPGLVGRAPSMRQLAGSIRSFAALPWPALILGETGSGKEVVARAMHAMSPRADEPFVAVNCGAIPEELAESELFGHERGAFTGADARREGLVARAGAGTLFLDEVGELSPRVQVKVLRLIQEKTYEPLGGRREQRSEARILAATHRDLEAGEDGFRDDLYYRLAACVLHVPPLRERREDIPLLAEHLLKRSLEELPGVSLKLAPDALGLLSGRPWPGNVRELENALRGGIGRALGEGAGAVHAAHFAPPRAARGDAIPDDLDLKAATDRFQRLRVEAALRACDDNRTRAAELLGVSRQWLHRLMDRWSD